MLEDKRVCERCGHPIHRQPYLMSIQRDVPIVVQARALAVLAALILICLIAAKVL